MEPKTKKGLDLKNLIEGDLFELAGLENLPEGKKEEMISKMMESVRDRVMVRIVEELGQENEAEFFSLLDENNDDEIREYLDSYGIKLDMLVTEEALVYKKELLDLIQQG
ncbi:MAG: hypothetical protein WC570_00600 [Patescibacteria group bacterium]